MRLRWPPDGPTLSRARVRVGARGGDLLPARPAILEPLDDSKLTAQQAADDLLDLADVTGKRLVATTLRGPSPSGPPTQRPHSKSCPGSPPTRAG